MCCFVADLIEEIIKEHIVLPLPGPPPPPPDLFGPVPIRQNRRTVQQNPPSTSNPVLVPRGAACKVSVTFYKLPQKVFSVKQNNTEQMFVTSFIKKNCNKVKSYLGRNEALN